MIGVTHDRRRHLGRVLETLQSANGPGAAGGSVHHRCVELHHADRVGQTAVTDARVFGVRLDQRHARHRGLQRVAARAHQLDSPRRGS